MVERYRNEKEITERGKSFCFGNLSLLIIIIFLIDRGGLLLHSIPPPYIQSVAKGRDLNWNSSLSIKLNENLVK